MQSEMADDTKRMNAQIKLVEETYNKGLVLFDTIKETNNFYSHLRNIDTVLINGSLNDRALKSQWNRLDDLIKGG
jgi:tRNA(Ile2) C34 agmatinyltransferase TiaS